MTGPPATLSHQQDILPRRGTAGSRPGRPDRGRPRAATRITNRGEPDEHHNARPSPMTSVTVTPIQELVATAEREAAADEFADLLTALADLAVGARRQRERLTRLEAAADGRVRRAVEH